MPVVQTTLASLVVLTIASLASAWGSRRLSERFYPNISFKDSFPEAVTVTVLSGGSVASAQNQCDEIVGSNGYCTIKLMGNPSDYPIDIYRSRTKLTSMSNVVLNRSGSGSFLEVTTRGIRSIMIEGLSIKGHRASEVFGIFIFGQNMRGIIMKDCKIYDFDGTENAHGIAVYGIGPRVIRDVHITGNEVYNMRTGSSESIVVNGFVIRWAISDNHVHDVNNIAIDAIGGEGTLPPSRVSGRVLPHPKDSAKNGFIEDNLVERMSTRSNPAYGNEETWAAGIYVDGAQRVIIRRNEVKHAPWAYEIGAENCVITKHVLVKDNIASGSFFGDFLAGGYAKKGFRDFPGINCDPRNSEDSSEGHGYVQRITVSNNDFKTTDSTEENILAQYRLSYAIIKEPGVEPVNADGSGSATGDDNAIRTT